MAEKQMSGFRARLDYALKHINFIYRLFNVSVSTVMKTWGLFVSQDDKMVIFSGHSRKYNDSPKAIYERMLEDPRFKDYKLVWALEDVNTEIPGNPIKVKSDTPKYFWYTLKAKYWCTCVNIERSLHYKKKGCRYLHTWHGLSLNHIGNDVPGRKDFDFDAVDYMCYESDYHKAILMRAFKVREETMIPTGLPRNDTLYKTTPEEVIELKRKLGLPLDKKLILYAPTWRDSTDNGASYEIKPPIDVDLWEKELKDQYVVLFRTHSYTTKLLGVEFNDFCRDFCSYPVINDLFKVADVLISDYSACVGDFSILERPIICFAYDYEEYSKARGLYLDLEKDMPSGVMRKQGEVIDHLKNMDYQKECMLTKTMIKDKLTYFGGNATDKCIEYLFEK